MVLKFCPSGESGGQQRGPGKSHRDQPHAQEDCRLCGDVPGRAGGNKDQALGETLARLDMGLTSCAASSSGEEKRRNHEETKVIIC